MNTGNEDFEKLRKLLKLKQHELPPPGYFARFPDLVINRIRAEDNSGILTNVPWFQRLIGLLESSPMTAGVVGAAFCAMLVFGLSANNQGDSTSTAALAPVNGNFGDASPHSSALALNADSGSQIFNRNADAILKSNPGSPFGGFDSMSARVEPVSFLTTTAQ